MTHVSRRTLAKGAAWAAPAVIATTTMPAYAASLEAKCPTSYSIDTDRRSDGGLPVISYDEGAFVTFTADALPADAIITFDVVSVDVASVDTSLWQVVSSKELKYIGPANKEVVSRFALTDMTTPEEQPYVDLYRGYLPSDAWSESCTQYGVPAGDSLCLSAYDNNQRLRDTYRTEPLIPRLVLESQECGIFYEKYLYIDYTARQSYFDYSIENLSVTADAISFTYTGSLYGLVIYTDAEDATPMLNTPEPFTPVMDYLGYAAHSTSQEIVTARTFTIPLSGEKAPHVQIGRLVNRPPLDLNTFTRDDDANYKYYVGNPASDFTRSAAPFSG